MAVIIRYPCPECGCFDLRPVWIDREGKHLWGNAKNAQKVAQCFKCGWREETAWECGKRMADETIAKLKLNISCKGGA